MSAVGQKVRCPVGPAGHARDSDRCATSIRNAHDRCPGNGRENNRAVAVPRRATRTWRVGQSLNGTTSQPDPLKFPCRKESNRTTVRRPERIQRTFGAGNGSRQCRRKISHPQLRLAGLGGNKCEVSSIRRQRNHGWIAGRRRRDLQTHLDGRGRSARHVADGEHDRREQQCERCGGPEHRGSSAPENRSGSRGIDRDRRRRAAVRGQAFERERKIGRGLKPCGRTLLQTAIDDPLQCRRHRPLHCGQIRRILLEDGRHHIDRRIAAERAATREHFVEQRTERKDVRARVGG